MKGGEKYEDIVAQACFHNIGKIQFIYLYYLFK